MPKGKGENSRDLSISVSLRLCGVNGARPIPWRLHRNDQTKFTPEEGSANVRKGRHLFNVREDTRQNETNESTEHRLFSKKTQHIKNVAAFLKTLFPKRVKKDYSQRKVWVNRTLKSRGDCHNWW